MPALRILSKCAAHGQHLAQSSVLTVPDDLPAETAAQLVRMGRAEWLPAQAADTLQDPAPAPMKRTRKKAD